MNYFIEALSFSRSAGEAKVAFEINVDWSMETVGGDGWRMPTLDEIKELLDDCSWRWTSQNGVNGYKVTGPSGNSIFLPAAGDCFGTEVVNRGSYGDYWSGSLYEYRSLACSLSFGSGNHDWSYYDWSYYYRYYGHPVRPVTE